ncbi:MAG TPA: sugar-binding domain-containing protein, partial [Jatrophihabitantaceae bacterium]
RGRAVPRTSTELILMARAARRYYLDDVSKKDIADELGISRFRVARLIDAARRTGMVRIQIESPAGIDAELSVALQERFGLVHAVVVDLADEHTEALRSRLGQVAAEVLQDVVHDDDVLGMAWARSLRGIGASIKGLAACPVVQLTGALSGPDGSDVIDLVRRVAAAGGGTPHVFYAPLVAPDLASARVVRRQPDVSRAMALAAKVTVAVVGIGAWQPGMSTIFDMVEPAARERARAQGTIGEISGALIDASGRAVTSALSRRIIGVTAAELEAIDVVISVAYGEAKARAVSAALRGGFVNGLITHTALARALLGLDRSAGAAAD